MAMETLISATAIQSRVISMGSELTELYRGQPLTVLGVLKGSVVFVADLIRRIDIPHQIGFIRASSYRGESTRRGQLTIGTELMTEIANRHVLLVDDIFDTGMTLTGLLNELKSHRPLSVQTAVLLWKQGRSEVEMTPDHHGFQIPNQFVVGYGLDYNDDYRHLPYIAVLEATDIKSASSFTA